jgi:hypothetical protein
MTFFVNISLDGKAETFLMATARARTSPMPLSQVSRLEHAQTSSARKHYVDSYFTRNGAAACRYIISPRAKSLQEPAR